jgi:tRNA A-37 threonylcarbamoyl transferase component Bud32/streptogramin lyase
LSVSVDPRIGSELFGYRVEALLGRGGMSVVYRAHDLALDRKVALKLLAPELAEDERFRSRFLRESRVAASLDHPSVIPIYEAGESEGLLCIAMRYVEGTDLKRRLRAEGALEAEQALDYCAQVAAALDTAHAHGLVHRDVKPSNVLISTGGHCYLADFGLTYETADRSDLTVTGQMLGSVDYAAPEQIEGKPVDGRADVYSLGCVLYECLTGSVPFPRDSDLAALWAHVNESPPRLPSHPELEPVLKRALAKRPDDRFPTCGALVDAARDALPKPEAPPSRRRYGLIALVALLLAGGLAVGLVLGLGGGGTRSKAALTARNATVVRIDPDSNKITAVIRAGAPDLLTGPFDVAVGGDAVWVYNWRDQTVRRVNPRTNAVERIVAIGGIPPVTGNAIAADVEGAWVLSTKNGSGVLTHVGPGYESTQDYRFGYEPVAVAIGAGAVWVAARSASGEVVLRFSPTTGAVLKTVRLPGSGVQSIAVADGAVWVLSNRIFRLDPATGRITGRVDLSAHQVVQIAAGPAGLWATVRLPRGANGLIRIDPRSLRVSKTIAAPASSNSTLTHVALGRTAVWWNGADAGTVWKVDPKTGTIISTVRITPPIENFQEFEPLGIAVGDDAVWVTVGIAP